MGTEIERKYLLRGDGWRGRAPGVRYRQGYLCLDPERTVRVRTKGDHGYLTIKGIASGLARPEFEYEIPAAEANQILDGLCLRPLIDKTRYRVPVGGRTWEIDEFHGENAGLVLAELELEAETERFEVPDWVGEEVTGDARYFNSSLVEKPFNRWPQKPQP